jgi:uncharacterized coiled-coil DUF342 family protein
MPVDYTGHILEQILDEMKVVHELVAEVPKMARKLDSVEQKVDKLDRDMEVVKAVMTHLSRDLEKHKSLPAHVAHGHA